MMAMLGKHEELRPRTDAIAPWLGLAMGGLYLAAVIVVAWAGLRVQHQQLADIRQENARRSLEILARHITQFPTLETVAAEIRRAPRGSELAFCQLVSPNGGTLAHSDPTQVGQPAAVLTTTGSTAGVVRIATDANSPSIMVLACPVVLPQQAGTGELRVGLEPLPFAWKQNDLLFWGGYVLLGVLGLYLLMYRLLTRSIQPLNAIRGRLLAAEKPTVEKVKTLRLNDSYDQISSSWNHLIEFVSQMQEQVQKSELAVDVSVAMDGYRAEKLSDVLMRIPFGVLMVDGEQRISFANRSAVGMLADDGQALEGVTVREALNETLAVSLLSGVKGRGGGQGVGHWIDHTFQRPHGEVTLRFWSVAGDDGDDVILFVQDITQAKEAERARDQFLYHITHELRTPLTNIRAYAETLSQGVIDDEQTIRECYNVIMSETQRLSRLVEDILNVSQLEVGSARLDVNAVAMDQLLRNVVQDMQGHADAKNIDLSLGMPAKMPKVRGDKDRLTVVLTNLVGNAVKYTPTGGRVEIQCTVQDDWLRIGVTDTGIGIAPEYQEKVFDKFFRVNDPDVAAIPGTGLGLAIVKETVRLHGGSVFLESTLGKGSTFTVSLPTLALDESRTSGRLPGEAREKA